MSLTLNASHLKASSPHNVSGIALVLKTGHLENCEYKLQSPGLHFVWPQKENTFTRKTDLDDLSLLGKVRKNLQLKLPWNNAFWPGLTPFGPPMWQA